MSRPPSVLCVALALALPGGAASASTGDGRWRRPLDGSVAASFTFDPAAPYAGGRRRGIDLRGARGAFVRTPCSGTVTWAGRVPAGRGLAVRCGSLVATVLGLGDVAVARGARVPVGAVVGRLGGAGVLRLGARRSGARHGYVDPAALLGRGGRAAPPPVAPAPGGVRRPRPAGPPPGPRAVGPTTEAPREGAAPPLAYAGLGLAAAGLGAGGVVRRRRARRRAVAVPVAAGWGRYR